MQTVTFILLSSLINYKSTKVKKKNLLYKLTISDRVSIKWNPKIVNYEKDTSTLTIYRIMSNTSII